MVSVARVASGSSGTPRWMLGVLRSRESSILLALVAIVVAATIVNPGFVFSEDGWRNLLVSPSVLILIAVGEAIVIITRNIDLSVGSVLGLTAYFSGSLFADFRGIPIVVVAIAAVLLGAFLGLINGALVAFVRVPSLVITLGTLYAYRGIDVLWVGGNRIFPTSLPNAFVNLGVAQILTIPVLTIGAAIVAVCAAWFMRNRRAGRELYAIGSDPAAAELYGLRTRRLVIMSFLTSGSLTGLAGVFYMATYATADSQVGTNWELQAVASAVIGGVAIFGGSGSIWGAAIGAFLLTTIDDALPVLGIPSLWQQAVVGIFIVGAISLDRLLFVRRSRRMLTLGSDTHE